MSTYRTFYGSSSEESLPLPPGRTFGFLGPNHVRVMLLHNNQLMVLMRRTEGSWDLPLFKYKTGIMEGSRSKRVCRDFAKWFSNGMHFVFVVELIGIFEFYDYDYDYDEDVHLADLKLAVLEQAEDSHIDSITLPVDACWKDSDFVSELLKAMDDKEERVKPLEIVLRCIQPGSAILSSITEPRCHLGWFKKASDFLRSVVNDDGAELRGPIVQEKASFTSTILFANTSQRRYFLKSPARGSNETEVTAKISSLFEGCTPEVVATSSELGCFVTREITTRKLMSLKRVVDTLGQIQLKSVSCIEELKEAGCVVRDLKSISDQVKRWADGYTTGRLENISDYIGQSACYIMYLCRRIGELEMPLTLVHGDFGLNNIGYDTEDMEKMILFDWEFACISHPFLDFFIKGRRGVVDRLREDVIRGYLELWTDYADIATLREAYTMAMTVGHILRIWSLWDRAAVCEHQLESALEDWMITEVDELDCSLETVIAADEGYQASPENQNRSDNGNNAMVNGN